jgi:hypothetical protein
MIQEAWMASALTGAEVEAVAPTFWKMRWISPCRGIPAIGANEINHKNCDSSEILIWSVKSRRWAEKLQFERETRIFGANRHSGSLGVSDSDLKCKIFEKMRIYHLNRKIMGGSPENQKFLFFVPRDEPMWSLQSLQGAQKPFP